MNVARRSCGDHNTQPKPPLQTLRHSYEIHSCLLPRRCEDGTSCNALATIVFERGLRQEALRHERIGDSHGGDDFVAKRTLELIARRCLGTSGSGEGQIILLPREAVSYDRLCP
jgi:hypothetical protein